MIIYKPWFIDYKFQFIYADNYICLYKYTYKYNFIFHKMFISSSMRNVLLLNITVVFIKLKKKRKQTLKGQSFSGQTQILTYNN